MSMTAKIASRLTAVYKLRRRPFNLAHAHIVHEPASLVLMMMMMMMKVSPPRRPRRATCLQLKKLSHSPCSTTVPFFSFVTHSSPDVYIRYYYNTRHVRVCVCASVNRTHSRAPTCTRSIRTHTHTWPKQ